MKHFNFWQKWLLFISLYLVLFGLVMAFFNQSPLMDLMLNNQIDPVFWPEGNPPDGGAAFQAFIYGVLGATIAGWGVFMAFLTRYPFKAREKWAWNCFAAGIAVWYIADTAVSLHYRVTFNVLFNTALLILAAPPLLFTRKDFH